MFKREWTTCSKFVNHSRFNYKHNWKDLYDRSMRILRLSFNWPQQKQAVHGSNQEGEATNQLAYFMVCVHTPAFHFPSIVLDN